MIKLSINEHTFYNFMLHCCDKYQGQKPALAEKNLRLKGRVVVQNSQNDKIFAAKRFVTRLEAAYGSMSLRSIDNVAHRIIAARQNKPETVLYVQRAMAWLDASRPVGKAKFYEVMQSLPQ